MKKNIFIISVLVLACVSAVPALAGDFKIGVSAGFDMTNTDQTYVGTIGNAQIGYYPIPSYNINAYLGYKPEGRLGFSIEPGLIRKGAARRDDVNYGGQDSQYKLNYIQAPVLADIYLTKRLFISVGPEFGLLAKALVYTDGGSYDVDLLYDNRLEISGILGINYSLFKFLDLGFKYNHGIIHTTSITYTGDSGDEIGETRDYNQYWQFMVRFKI